MSLNTRSKTLPVFLWVGVIILYFLYIFIRLVIVGVINYENHKTIETQGTTTNIGIGAVVSVQQTRLYYGVIRIPVSMGGVDFSTSHNVFFYYIMPFVTVISVVWEFLVYKYRALPNMDGITKKVVVQTDDVYGGVNFTTFKKNEKGGNKDED